MADNAGHLLVFPHVGDEDAGTPVDVFMEDGVYLGRMRFPPGIQPRLDRDGIVRASERHIVVVTTDELGVPYVVRLQIIKPS